MERQTTLISDIVSGDASDKITARPEMFMDDDDDEVTRPTDSEDVASNEDVLMSENEANNEPRVSKIAQNHISVEVDENETTYTYGVNNLPLSKTKRILKADPNYTQASESTTLLITKSAEYFVKHIMTKAYMNASAEKRKKIQYKDFSDAVFNNEELYFLKRIIPRTTTVRNLIDNNTIKARRAQATSIKNVMKKDNKESKAKGKQEIKERQDTKVKSNTERREPTLAKGQQTLNFKAIKNPEIKKSMNDALANDSEKTITSDSTEEESENDGAIIVEDNVNCTHENTYDMQDDTQVSNGTIDENDDELTEDE